MRTIATSMVIRLASVSAAMAGLLLCVLPGSRASAAESAPVAVSGVVTPAEPTKSSEGRAVTSTPAAVNEAAASSANQSTAGAASEPNRNQRRSANRKAAPKPVPAVAGTAATAAAGAAKPDPTLAEATEKARPALIVDGASATPQPAAGAPKTPEIEVRVSATQQRENSYRDAVNAIGEGRTDEGVRRLQQLIAEHPGQDNARQILIGVALRAKQFARAEALADDRLAHGNEHLGFAVVSARLKLDRSDPAAALDVLKRSEVHAGSSPEYQALMAAVLQRLSRHGEAAERFRAALALQPGTGIWQMGLGLSLQALERPVEAVEAFKRARDGTGLTPELRAFVDERVAELQR